MKKNKSKLSQLYRLFLPMCICVTIASCSNLDSTIVTDTVEENEAFALTEAWICDMKSFEEDQWNYQIYLESNGDYVAISNSRILKVSKDGILNSIIMLSFPDNDYSVFRIFNDKIFRFHYQNDFQNFDPAQPIKVQIYDFDFNLLSQNELASNGIIYDVEVETDNLFGLLVYTVDNSTMTLKKLSLADGLVAEIVLSTNGTSPRNLHISEAGDYICSASSNKNNLFFLDNDLNLIWAKELNQYLLRDVKYISGQGIYITGRVSPFIDPDRPTYVALVDLNGNVTNSVEFDAGERWSPYMEINQDRICIVQTEPESGLNMLLSILDYDLNVESTLNIPGNIVQSDLIVNENGSFSFVYGIALDPDDPDFFPEHNTRIFKFDKTYTIPTNVIIQ